MGGLLGIGLGIGVLLDYSLLLASLAMVLAVFFAIGVGAWRMTYAR
jgi:hypothetical protein